MRQKSIGGILICLAFLSTGCASFPISSALQVLPGVTEPETPVDDVDAELSELVATMRHDLTISRARERERLAVLRPAPAPIQQQRPNYINVTPLAPESIEAFAQRTTLMPALLVPVVGVDPNDLRDNWGASRDGGRRRHRGIDIFAPRGREIVAVADGYITYIGNQPKGGHCVWLTSESGYAFYYAHLDRWAPGLYEGMQVRAGDLLGYVGTTGNARNSSPHLHFSVHAPGEEAVNPYPLLRFARMASSASSTSYSGFSRGGTE